MNKNTGTMTAQQIQKRNYLLDIQKRSQEYWLEENVTHVEASDENKNKFMVTFPFPYVNGALHLGHAFTFSKGEIAARFQKMCGKQVLFPFGFHASGMPINSCADKLSYELNFYGNPPNFPPPPPVPEGEQEEKKEAPKKSSQKGKSNRNKLVAKTGNKKYQWEIMQESGIPDIEIPKFSDPQHWLNYFPVVAKNDLTQFGAFVDWRRSFITTDKNPYFDSFARWQLDSLRASGKVLFGKRNTIWSPIDNQPCLDHERSSGEGVGPIEYTVLKIKVTETSNSSLLSLSQKYNVYLAAVCTSPIETMYGLTNCWVHPELSYGAYVINDTDVFICSARAAFYQEQGIETGKPQKLISISGSDLVGVKCKSPIGILDSILILPNPSITEDKGTGIETSVPSCSPESYIMLENLRKDETTQKKYGIFGEVSERVKGLEPIGVIATTVGSVPAKIVCEEQKIKNIRDTVKLAEAKNAIEKINFDSGTFLVGPYTDKIVKDVKKQIQAELFSTKQAIMYAEPEFKVISRSGGECVVALADQWYIPYGEEEWKKSVKECLDAMKTYGRETREEFEKAIEWLGPWACSRTYGLGSKISWAPQYLIESLSDSTIYMAYYTISHLLQGGVIDGSEGSPIGIRPEQLTNDVWDYIFRRGPFPEGTTIPNEALEKMRREYEYWYPMDLRISGRDLIKNHLTFCMYNHVVLFPKDKWPKGMRANGFLLLNSRKMSKSEGNFLTLENAIELYTADATRIILADAGDGVEDANFIPASAESAMYKLYSFVKWAEEILEGQIQLREGEYNFYDRAFDNTINTCITNAYQAYDKMKYHDAVQAAFYSMLTYRDAYRKSCEVHHLSLHSSLSHHFIASFCLILSPIAPHSCEHIWKLLGNMTSIVRQPFPKIQKVDEVVQHQWDLLEEAKTLIQQRKKGKKGEINIVVNVNNPPWLNDVISVLSDMFMDNTTQETVRDRALKVFEKDFPHVPTQELMHMFAAFKLDRESGRSGKAILEYNAVEFLREHTNSLALHTEVTTVQIEERVSVKLPGLTVNFKQ